MSAAHQWKPGAAFTWLYVRDDGLIVGEIRKHLNQERHHASHHGVQLGEFVSKAHAKAAIEAAAIECAQPVDELPPLPNDPFCHVGDVSMAPGVMARFGQRLRSALFTADQMQAYALTALAAKRGKETT